MFLWVREVMFSMVYESLTLRRLSLMMILQHILQLAWSRVASMRCLSLGVW